MKKNISKLILVLLLAVLVLSLVACTPEEPPTVDTPDDPAPETPEPVTFTVTFDSKGGTGIEKQTGIEFGQSISAPTSTPTKPGYIFDCWMLPDGQTPIDFSSYLVYSDVTLYASWIAKTYDITAYLTDEGRKDKILDITTDTVSAYYGDSMSVNDKFSLEKVNVDGVETWSVKNILLRYEGTSSSTQYLPVPTTSKVGDRFIYWYTYEGDTIVPVTESLPLGSTDQYVDLINGYQYDGSMTIYAMWYSALENITVRFDTAEQSAPVTMDDIIIKEGDHLSTPNDPSATGYDFKKWTYTLIDKDNDDEDTNKTIVEMDFYLQPTHHGTHISWDMTTDGVFTLYANWIKRIDIASASDWTSLDASDTAVQNANIYLINSIKLDDYTTIFDDKTPFCGVFDGKGNTITYTISTSENGFYSFIGVNNGTIKNLIVNNVTISENTPSEKKELYVGLVAGISRGTIENIAITDGAIALTSDNGTINAGGVVGLNYGGVKDVARVEDLTFNIASNNGYIGGISGNNMNGYIQHANIKNILINGTMDNNGYAGIVAGKIAVGDCTKISVVTSSVKLTAKSIAYGGGVAGYITNNTIEQCFLGNCYISVGAEDTQKAYAGGIVGYGSSAIFNTSLSGTKVDAISKSITVAGGIAGVNFCEVGNRGQIQYIVAQGDVSAKSAGTIYVGGICGQQNASASSQTSAVAYVYAEFNVSATRLSSTPSDVTVKIGKAFGVSDASACKQVYVTTTSTILVDNAEYTDITTNNLISETTPGTDTIKSAQWVKANLKLDTRYWTVADDSYPALIRDNMNEPIGANFHTLTMACLGDSITMGNGEGEAPYCNAVGDILNLKDIYNYGVSWSTIGYMKDCHCHTNNYNHYPYVYRYSNIEQADIIAVMGGINDFGVYLPLGTIEDYESNTFYGALNMLASGLKTKFNNSYIFFMTGFKYEQNSHVNAIGIDFSEYNQAIVDVCEKYNIDCFDVYNEIQFSRSLNTVDGIHPTEDFVNNTWSPQIAQFIRDNYKSNS